MKKIAFFLLIMLLCEAGFCQPKTNASKPQGSTKKTAQKGKTPPVKETPKPVLVQLPSNSNDCFFAVEIKSDFTSEAIAAPKGSGYIMEIIKDAKNPELFELEHNVIWYTFTVPYSSKLLLNIIPENARDDYDFLLFKSTDQYFCNKVANKKVKPILSNLSAPNPQTKGAIGISLKGDKKFINKKSTDAYVSSIDVVKGDVYYLIIDNLSPQSKSYKLNLEFYIDGIKPNLRIIDDKDRKPLSADILLVEKGSEKAGESTEDRIVMNKKNFLTNNIVLVPGYNYSIYVKKEGYFSYHDEFNSDKYLSDTLISIPLKKIVKGTKFPIKNLSFDDETAELTPESKEALSETIQLLTAHPEISIEIKGYVNPYDQSIEKSIEFSRKQAESVMKFFTENGVNSSRMTAVGMTSKEGKSILENYIRNSVLLDKRIEIIIK